ncbi:MAG: 30S ribosomal protein S12 methylthiotransferase RimO [Candidatus Riflebacteria bacterium HGW-Riflebacteria-2]|jgi:ribosomal protein S12 methylthiotransferase|nr:MAG: 30S ribosomal protein S12 methylthiotransferase RimO [Candidatus Riflebacteria bacterium HGW-Riflebacteria-2]
MKFHLISLGCTKNTADSEHIANRFAGAGWVWAEKPDQADLIMINTCGFIRDAKEESLATIMDNLAVKSIRPEVQVCVFGCLVKRYRSEIQSEIPEIDHLFEFLSEDQLNSLISLLGPKRLTPDFSQSWRFFTPPHIGILKIAEGCSNRCTYCAIPGIRGPFHSRPHDEIIADARQLAASGAKELSVVAQDITRYGSEIGDRCTLPALVKELSAIEGIEWLRLHYMHPRGLTQRLIDELYSIPKVLPYFDIPFQHISKRILEAMNRHTSPEHLVGLIRHIRSHFPDSIIRSTFIVGFPGEQKRDFERLINFIEEHPLDRVGAFAYSEEEGTLAEKLKPQTRTSTRQARLDQLMTLQQLIVGEQNQRLVNKVTQVIVDEILPDRVLARTTGDAYEVDNTTTIMGRPEVKPGDIIEVRITSADSYDFTAEMAE